MTENTRGALLMVMCMVAFTINDAFMKLVLATLPLMQALFLRGVLTTICLFGVAVAMRGLVLPARRSDRWLILLRTLAEILGAFLFMTALARMPIANVSAILQVLPLSVTLVSALVFRDPLGWRRLTAIGIGFVGVLLIVRPGTEGFNVYSLSALAAVAAVTVRDLAARGLSGDVPSSTVALATAMGVTVAAGLTLPFVDWVPVSGDVALLLVGSTLFVVFGYLGSVMAMRIGEIGVIAPFRYASLIAALVLGLVLFGEWPSGVTLLGAAIIVTTGVFTLYREHRLSLAARRAPVPVTLAGRTPTS